MKNIDELKNIFIKAAVIHGEATETGNHKVANKQYDIIVNVYKELQKNEGGTRELQQLMYYKNPSVQSWAASYCLQFYPDEAKKVLQNVQENGGLVGFSAKITLREWEKGNLTF